MSRNILTVLVAMSLAACGNIDEMSPEGTRSAKGDGQETTTVLITQDMNGQTMTVKVGDEVKVWLPSNPSTGYTWELLNNSKSFPLLDSGFVPESEAQVAGSGGHAYFIFAPGPFVANKTFTLRFTYARPWEKTAIVEFSVNLAIQELCPPVECKMYCEYGFQKDASGCDVCKCADAPACPPVECKMYCEYGFQKDMHGCDVCKCADPFACVEDADCTLAKQDCCGCQAGGVSIAINKDFESYFAVSGCENIACPAVYVCGGPASCVNNRCESGGPRPIE